MHGYVSGGKLLASEGGENALGVEEEGREIAKLGNVTFNSYGLFRAHIAKIGDVQ